jgi:hypothetical protein
VLPIVQYVTYSTILKTVRQYIVRPDSHIVLYWWRYCIGGVYCPYDTVQTHMTSRDLQGVFQGLSSSENEAMYRIRCSNCRNNGGHMINYNERLCSNS